jgi:hypothetical protein
VDKSSKQFEKEIRRVGANRLAQARKKTAAVMQRRADAKAAFNEATRVFEQRQSVLIKRVE